MTHSEFIARCAAIGVNGGRNAFTEDVLRRLATRGNTKAQALLEEWIASKKA